MNGIIAFGAPYSLGFKGTLPEGEILILDTEQPGPQGMWLKPERYNHFEVILVPEKDRSNPDYEGYAVGCRFDQVGTDFELLK